MGCFDMTIIIDRWDLQAELADRMCKLSTEDLCVLAEHMLDTGHTSLGYTMVLGDKVDAILKEVKET
jgi:hypothetical protein|tara:strand:+ start:560 stop:760 length:201 start_codon:yes stop_codon:yes gene_type:complete